MGFFTFGKGEINSEGKLTKVNFLFVKVFNYDTQIYDSGLYAKQDELLKRIFGGEYGSTEENQLEELLDQHEELRNRIVEANFKWKQAQLMVDYAFKQLNEAVSKWTAVPNIDASRLEEKCVMCLYLFCTHSCILDTAWP